MYLNKGKVDFLIIDFIYDYFEILFKKEVFNESVYIVWLKVNNVLLKIKDKI